MYTLAELFDQAVRHHQSGYLDNAENLCRRILQADPCHAHAWHFLGIMAGQVGRHDAAAEYIGNAIRFLPDFGPAHINLGNVFRDQGKPQEAETCYRQGLRLMPNIAEAHISLGNVLYEQAKLEEAEACCRAALRLKPDLEVAHYNLGNVLCDQGNLEEAEACYRTVVRLQPSYAEAHSNLGIVLREQGKLEEAEASYRQALRLKPDLAEVHSNLGNVLRDQGKLEEAEARCREALRLQPNYAGAHNNLGSVLQDQGRLEEAKAGYSEALRLKPSYAEAHNNLGNVLLDQGMLQEAEASYREALRLKRVYAEAHGNLGIVLRDQGRFEEAGNCYRESIRLKPEYGEGHFNWSCLLLLQGNFALGWPEYEWRRQIKDNLRLGLKPSTWDGSALNGQTILLQAEQGIGDTFQFVRYAPLVKKKGGRILLQCPPALAGILSGCPGIDQLVPAGMPLPSYQVTAPLLSLPFLFKTTLETIPAQVPYLTAEPTRVDHWRSLLAAIPGLKVGICWQGNPTFKGDRLRSVPLATFAPLAAVPGICLIALQRGPGLEQMAQQNEHLKIVDLPGRSEDPAQGWLDTAALIEALDLVISIDTGAVHLAGALGAPVWVALPFMPDWRWLLNRADSPWYPTVRLFRQQKLGAWLDVFQHIAVELGQLVSARETKSPRTEVRGPGEIDC